MIEGLRLLAPYQEAADQGLVPSTCEECKSERNARMRQQMGCAYEAPIAIRPYLWAPLAWRKRDHSPSVCPGYSTRLPLVEEIVKLLPHWEAGSLEAWLDGEPTSRPLLDGLAHAKRGIDEQRSANHDERIEEMRRKHGGPR